MKASREVTSIVINAAGGDPIDVTANLAASVQTITWNGSDSAIVATEFAAGDEVLAIIDADFEDAA